MHKREFSNTIPIGYARPLINELRQMGDDVLPGLWQSAGINTSLDAVLKGVVAALPTPEFSRLYRHGIGTLETWCCERDGHRPLGILAVNMLCYCVIHCSTLGKAVERAARFNDAMEERGGRLATVEHGATAQFTMETRRGSRDHAALLVDLTGLYFYHQLFSWLIGRPLNLKEVALAYPPPDPLHQLIDVFGAPLRFDQPVNSFSFPARLLNHKVVRSYSELEAIIDYFPFDFGLAAIPEFKLSDQVRLLLLDALQHRGAAPSCETVAQLFHMSTATLRRRLRAEHCSYGDLRALCQLEAAQHLLTSTDMHLTDIAARIGMNSDRAFRRAFRDWMGIAPSEYRLGANKL